MINKLLKIGDEVTINIPNEHKELFKFNYPKGTKGEVIGIFQNWVVVRLLISKGIYIVILGFIRFADKNLHNERLEELVKEERGRKHGISFISG